MQRKYSLIGSDRRVFGNGQALHHSLRGFVGSFSLRRVVNNRVTTARA